MMEQQEISHARWKYNEIILKASHWTSRLPRIIQAVFFPSGSEHGEARARDVHLKFLTNFGVTRDTVPLVRLNLEELDSPFSIAE